MTPSSPPAFRVAGEREEGLRRAREEHIEDRGARAPRDGAQLGGQRESHMEVVHWQEPLEPLVDPSCLRERLALGAVPIAARVVRREGRKPKADPMAKRTPGIPGPSACHEPFGT